LEVNLILNLNLGFKEKGKKVGFQPTFLWDPKGWAWGLIWALGGNLEFTQGGDLALFKELFLFSPNSFGLRELFHLPLTRKAGNLGDPKPEFGLG